MNMKKVGKIAAIGAILVIVAVFAFVSVIFYDAMSYTATGFDTLHPNGTEVGKALVVYDPGLSGAAKNTAGTITSDLQAKGYTVDLAGISSSKAANTSGYNIIVVGGPIYGGNASISVQAYLKTLNPAPGARVGVFATGQDPDTANDIVLLRKEAAPLPGNSTLQINAVVKVVTGTDNNGTDNNQKLANFVNTLLQ
jgi:menaquinone-dependent protoporphyrinogen IX oxidase